MSYFNFKKGRPIARVVSGTNIGRIIYLVDTNRRCGKCKGDGKCKDCKINGGCVGCSPIVPKQEIEKGNPLYFLREEIDSLFHDGVKEVHLKDSILAPIPRQEHEQVDNIYVFGPNGAGKSYFAAEYVKEYKKIYPKRPIYLFSGKDKDKVLDDLQPSRIKIDDDLVDDPIEYDELEKSLVIFDDVGHMKNKKIQTAIQDLKDALLEKGRAEETYVLSLTHNPTNNKVTKTSLMESSAIALFPYGGDEYHVRKVLEIYCGLTKSQVDRVMHLQTRWVICYKHYPKYILYEHGCYFLS